MAIRWELAIDRIAQALQHFHCCRVNTQSFAELPEIDADTPGYGESKETYRAPARQLLDEITVLRIGPFRVIGSIKREQAVEAAEVTTTAIISHYRRLTRRRVPPKI